MFIHQLRQCFAYLYKPRLFAIRAQESPTGSISSFVRNEVFITLGSPWRALTCITFTLRNSVLLPKLHLNRCSTIGSRPQARQASCTLTSTGR
ncbi:hypothetical protein O181_046354 [Austropuccinia psidii MF-1]|uniref:Uncharacterized protein n=1 Tax=Austropuccinia psidii MF-1 TaxID=1389203 RepID=A0A9Q3DNX4_9BASI|nr:hypothetical protein [Austropuccinia psidii MF-1]